jgi:hypothetical protein
MLGRDDQYRQVRRRDEVLYDLRLLHRSSWTTRERSAR